MTISLTGVSGRPGSAEALTSLLSARFASRLFAKDDTLWGEAAAAEAAVRLGWTDATGAALDIIDGAERLAFEYRAAGIDRIVLCGMGGSSLAPLVIAPALSVLDSTHPDAVRAALEGDLQRTAVVVSSKSGGTVETLSHLAAWEAAFAGAGIDAAERIVVVTDPGSALAERAAASGMRAFLADPTVGGRFSALTAFGIVPSVLAGADFRPIIAEAAAVRHDLSADSGDNPALALAAALHADLPERFVLELHPDGSLPAELGLWIEQLVAESTGKQGRGLLPVALPVGAAGTRSTAALSLGFGLSSPAGADARPAGELFVSAPLGAQLLLWQVVTAALGFLLGVDPFNQPDVEAAKIATRAALGGAAAPVASPPAASDLLAELRRVAPADGYLAIQAYVDPTAPELAEQLERLRSALDEELGIAVTAAYGPRYLHSTGQLHKGGPQQGAFLQLIDVPVRDVVIPGPEAGAELRFGELMRAQAHGDASVLRARGRAVVTVEREHVEGYLAELIAGCAR